MRLEKVIIDNFLSIEHLELDFNNLTVLIGPNNNGKTNILKALDVFFNSSKTQWKDLVTKNIEKEISIKCKFSNVRKFLPLINKTNQKSFSENIAADDTIWFQRKFEPLAKTSEINVFDISQEKLVNTVGITNANTILPKFEFIPTKLLLEDTAKIQKTNPLGKMLFDIFDKITPEEDKQYIENWKNIEKYFNEREDSSPIKELKGLEDLIQNNLKSGFPESVAVRLEVELPEIEDLLKGFKIKIHDGEWTDASNKGDGMQRALMFSILKSYSDFQKQNITESNLNEKDKAKKDLHIIFAIDEAELHLHPQSQKDLLETLENVSRYNDQVVYTTHSYLLAKKSLNKKIYAIKKNGKYTEKLVNSKNDLLKLMGMSPSDNDFPDNIIIVEGEADEKFFLKILELLNSNKKINIHFSGGDSNIINASEAINQMLRSVFYLPFYKDTICACFDLQENQRNIKDFKKHVCGDVQSQFERIAELDKNGIEFYYPKSILVDFFDTTIENSEIDKKIETFLSELKIKSHNHEVLKASFGNLGLVSKRDLADKVTSKMSNSHIGEIDIKILNLIKKSIELAL